MTKQANRQEQHTDRICVFIRAGMALCLIAIVVFSVLLIQSKREYAAGDAAYEELQMPETSAEPEKIDFAFLASINPDVVGWIRSGGGAIDYPIVQGDDNGYYLTHLFNGRSNKLGSIFMDYRNSGDFSDSATIVYGHNMKNGSMFSSLTSYKQQSYYDAFPELTLYTPSGNYTVALFAGIIADGNYEFARFRFGSDADFLRYVENLRKQSTFDSETTIVAGDRIIVLSTCTYEFNNARYAVFGKLIPITSAHMPE